MPSCQAAIPLCALKSGRSCSKSLTAVRALEFHFLSSSVLNLAAIGSFSTISTMLAYARRRSIGQLPEEKTPATASAGCDMQALSSNTIFAPNEQSCTEVQNGYISLANMVLEGGAPKAKQMEGRAGRKAHGGRTHVPLSRKQTCAMHECTCKCMGSCICVNMYIRLCV